MTTEITYGAFKLLKAMVAGDTLRDRLMGCSRHQNYAVHDSAGRDRHVADHTAQQLIDARFIEPTGKDYRTYRYTEYPFSVTDAGRAHVAAINAPQEST